MVRFFFILIFGWITLIYISNFIKAYDTYNWKETKCKILKVKVVNNRSKYIDVLYEYKVKNKTYKSYHMMYLVKEFLFESLAEDFANENGIVKNNIVYGYYNPKNPKEAVLFQGISFNNISQFLLIVFLLIYSIRNKNDWESRWSWWGRW